MKNFELNPATSVRIAERDLNDEVGRYLSLIGSSRARDVRRMALTASGSGDRDVFVSYISEVPIWKSTYRIIFPDKPGEKPLLQGWAIVDNTIGEDWKDVQLSLVAGAPQSFVQNISQPFYTRRPVIALPESVMLTPQSHEASLQVAEPIPATETVEVQASAANVFTQSASLVGIAGKQSAEAEGKSAGDFFEYNVKQKISIARNQSALVPILQNHIEAEKVTLWNENSPPLRAVWIKNTSGQVLDAGSFNVLEADAFAGEGVLENIHPDERRLLSYAADAAVHVKFEDEASDNPYTRIKIAKGVMYLVQEQRAKKKYTIRDADTEARQVIVEFPAQEGWGMTKGTSKPEESSA